MDDSTAALAAAVSAAVSAAIVGVSGAVAAYFRWKRDRGDDDC